MNELYVAERPKHWKWPPRTATEFPAGRTVSSPLRTSSCRSQLLPFGFAAAQVQPARQRRAHVATEGQWCPALAPPTSGGGTGREGPAPGREAESPGVWLSLPVVSAGARRPVMSCYIYQLPAWVLDDLCRNMDTLSEWDWMHFGEWAP